jgi:hypothetical protein
MTAEAQFGFELLGSPPQATAEVLVNAALELLAAHAHLSVKSRALNQPTGSEVDGDRYMVGPVPAGLWSTFAAGDITVKVGSTWKRQPPKEGWVTSIDDEDYRMLRYSGSAWLPWPYPARHRFHAYDDFVGGTLTNNQPFANSSSGTGAAVSTIAIAGTATHPGIAQLDAGTTTAGVVAMTTRSSSCILFGGAPWRFEAAFRIPVLSDGTDTFSLRIGFLDAFAAESVDCAYLRYTHSVNAGKFEAVTRSNSSETVSDTGITVVANTWYRLRIEVNAAGTSIAFYLDDVLVATVTLTIPTGTGREVGAGAVLIKSAGTTSRTTELDYLEIEAIFASAR